MFMQRIRAADVPTSACLLSRIGRYEIVRLLARGGMGDVYLGQLEAAHGFRRHVVIKTIRHELVQDERAALMFVDEARVAASLHHQNVVYIVDFNVEQGLAYLVSEHVEGCDLRAVLDGLTLEQAVTIAIEVASGLHAAHEAVDKDGAPLQLIHRDVSPSNVLLGVHGQVKLTDFGVAKTRQRGYRTVSGSIRGKAPYMAPEQIRGTSVDRRCDVFALGVVLYEMAARGALYSADDDATAMQRILDGDVPPPACPDDLAHVVTRALSREPADRYPTAWAFAEDLVSVARAHRWRLSTSRLGPLARNVS